MTMRPRTALLSACPWLSRDEASEALRNTDGDVERAKISAVTVRRQQQKNRPREETTQHDRDRSASSLVAAAYVVGGEKENDETRNDGGKDCSSSLQPLVRVPPRHAVSINNLSDRQYCCVWSVEVYEDGYRPDVARTLLAKVARHVNPILRERGWRVKRLIESSSSSWIGLCTANGRNDADAASTNIQLNLRVRPDRRCQQFRSFRQVMAVMLHEIAHTKIGLEDIHPPAFYELLDEIKAEYRTKLAAGDVELETDTYGCDSNFVSSAGELVSVAASASDVLASNDIDGDMDLLCKMGSEGECGAFARRRRRGRGDTRRKRSYGGGAYGLGYTSNVEKKRPLLKGVKMVDKRTKAGRVAMAKRDGLSARELAARAALARFGSNTTTTAGASSSSFAAAAASASATSKTDGEIDMISSDSEGVDGDDGDCSTDESIDEHNSGCECRSCEWSKLFDSGVCSRAPRVDTASIF